MFTSVSTLYHRPPQSRIRTKRYGQTFLARLQPYCMTATITDVESFFEAEPDQVPKT
jgi:hypothetical protein